MGTLSGVSNGIPEMDSRLGGWSHSSPEVGPAGDFNSGWLFRSKQDESIPDNFTQRNDLPVA